jgi:hypothetical protein
MQMSLIPAWLHFLSSFCLQETEHLSEKCEETVQVALGTAEVALISDFVFQRELT